MWSTHRIQALVNVAMIVLLLFGPGTFAPVKAQEPAPAAAGDPQPELLKDIYTANASSDPWNFAAADDLLFFTGTDPEHGAEPWVSDGTSGGTRMVADLVPGEMGSSPFLFTSFDGQMFFTSEQENSKGLWITDGTLDGTSNIYPSNQPVIWMTPNGGWLYFSLEGKIIRYGGAGNTFEVITSSNLSVQRYINSYNHSPIINGVLFFLAYDSATGTELWGLDLNTLVSTRVMDIYPGVDPVSGMVNSSNPTDLTVVGNTLFFTAVDGTHGSELWASDGTPAGTRLVRDIMPGTVDWGYYNLTAVGGWLYFTVDDGIHGRELWRSDGTSANTELVADLAPGEVSGVALFPDKITSISGSEVLIPACNAAAGAGNGVELWKIPVTAAGVAASPVMLEIEPGPGSSHPTWMVQNGEKIYFAAYDSAGGLELWRSDGTPAGTERVADSIPGADGSSPTYLAVWNSNLVYNACDEDHGCELWMSDGTSGGTHMIVDAAVGTLPYGSEPSDGVITNVGGKNIRYFSAADALHGQKLWRTDGTAEGTWLVKGYSPWEQRGHVGLHPQNSVTLNGILYFTDFDFEHGSKIYRSDGTAAGTWMLRNPSADYQAGNLLIATDDTVYFISYPGPGAELWKTDGTSTGTVRVKTLSTAANLGATNLTVIGDTLIVGIVTFLDSNTFALWRSDGTEAGTQPIVGPTDEYPPMHEQMVIGNRLYFDRSDPSEPGVYRLWVTDGTTAGTHMVETNGTVEYESPRLFTALGNDLYFVAALSPGYMKQGLWKLADGESSVSLVMELDYADPMFLGALSSQRLVYLGNDGSEPSYPHKWFIVDLTEESFEPLCWVSYGCYPGFSVDYAVWQGRLYFSGTDRGWGEPADTLMVTDGTRAGTQEIKVPGSEISFTNGDNFLSTPNALYFSANDGVHGTEPWVIRAKESKIYLPLVRKP
jgi:ELWxxDGT repeat protein